MKKLSVALILSASTLVPALSQAQFARPSDAIEYRQSAFTILGQHFGRIGAVVKGQVAFDANKVKADMAVINSVAHLPWGAFGAGTQGGKSTVSVWNNNAKFVGERDAFQGKLKALNTAVQSGDLNKIKVAFGEAGQTCKSCHDNFRKK